MALVNLSNEGDYFIKKKWGTGLYEIYGLNPHIYMEELRAPDATDYPSFDFVIDSVGLTPKEKVKLLEKLPPDYGVVDSPTQFLALMGEKFSSLEGGYVTTFVEIRRDEQEPSGGWRWHKWGEYYGTQNQTSEYLYDELEIESVFVFKVFKLNKI